MRTGAVIDRADAGVYALRPAVKICVDLHHRRNDEMKNLLSCRTASYGKFADTAYEHIAAIGVRHVEIGLGSPSEAKATRAELERHGLALGSLTVRLEIDSEDAAEQFKPWCEACVEMGARHIFTSVRTGKQGKQVVYDRLRTIGDVAAAKDVFLCMETHPDLITNGTVALETMRAIDHPNVRVNFDTANVYYYNERVDGIVELRKIIDYIESVHLKDTNGEPQTHCFPTLGEGIVDFRTVFQLLNERGMHGPFTIENEGIAGEELTLEQTRERERASVQHLRDLGCVD